MIAEQLHRCALGINEVGRRLDSEDDANRESKFKAYSDEYSAVLQKYSVNHEKADFFEHKLYRSDEYEVEYNGLLGMARWIGQNVYVFWAHNYVWVVGVPVLVVCGFIVLKAVGLTF